MGVRRSNRDVLRPEASNDRLIYALGVNLLLGIIGTLLLLRWMRVRFGTPPAASCGFGGPLRTAASTVAAIFLGLASYYGQGAPSTHPVVSTNAFAQAFVVSVAEVLVCWSLVGATVEAVLQPRLGRGPVFAAAVVAAVVFGLYHFAHSAPFNTRAMVVLLAVVGLVTGLFFFVSRDALGTAVFHNFLGTFGVTQALEEAGALAALEVLQPPLVGTALTTAVALLVGYRWVRRPV